MSEGTSGVEDPPHMHAVPLPSTAVLQTLTGGDLTVFPHVIEFKDVEPGRVYSTVVRIQNSSTRSRRVRVIAPANKDFRVKFANDAAVAPGIEVVCEIIFCCASAAKPVSDALLIRADGGPAVRVPINAFPPLPSLQVFPQALDLGALILGNAAIESVEVCNRSFTMDADVTLTFSNDVSPWLSAHPTHFHLERATAEGTGSRSRQRITFEVRTGVLDEGEYETVASFTAPGLPPTQLPLRVRITEHIVQVRQPSTNEVVSLAVPVQLETVFFSQQSVKELELYNDGPRTISFSFQSKDGVPQLNDTHDDDAASVSTTGSVTTSRANIARKKEGKVITNASIDAAIARITSVKNPPLNAMIQHILTSGSTSLAKDDTRDGVELASASHFFSITPREGMIAPGERAKITVKFTPVDLVAPTSFKTQADLALQNAHAVIESEETNVWGDMPAPSGLSYSAQRAQNETLRIPAVESPGRVHGRYFEQSEAMANDSVVPAIGKTVLPIPLAGGRQAAATATALGLKDATKTLNMAIEADRAQALQARAAEMQQLAAPLKLQTAYEIACETSTPAPAAETFVASFQATIPELNLEVPFIVYGIAERPHVRISHHRLDFGRIPVDGRRDAKITVFSHVRSLPVRVNVGKVANVYIEPAGGLLPAGRALEMVVSVMPTRLGEIMDTIPIYVLPASASSSPKKPSGRPPSRASRLYDTSQAMEQFQQSVDKAVLALPLRIAGTTYAAQAVIVKEDTSALTTHEVIALAQTTAPSSSHTDTIAKFNRSAKFKDRIAHAPPEVYEEPKQFIETKEPGEPEETPRVTIKRVPTWAALAASRGLTDVDVATAPEYTYNIRDLRAQQAHKQAYVQFLRDSQRRRKSANGGIGADEELEMGIANVRSELRPPLLEAPRKSEMLVEPVWMARKLGQDGEEGRPAGNVYKFNPDKLIKKKYKPKPTTQAEMMDCTANLTEEELAAVSAGPPIIDFGTFNVYTVVKKNFTVVNDLRSAIQVELDIPPDTMPQLLKTDPMSQVLPPGAISGFDLTFYTEEDVTRFSSAATGRGLAFRETLTYVINGKYKQRIALRAQILPIELVLSKTNVYLRFPDSSLDRSVTEVITLKNLGTATAKFRWEEYVSPQSAMMQSASASALITKAANRRPGTASSTVAASISNESGHHRGPSDVLEQKPRQFVMEPLQGSIAPGETLTARITYTPVYNGRQRETYRLLIDGGASSDEAQHLSISGEEHDPKLQCSEKLLDFGKVGVGMSREVSVTLKNAGSTPAVFWVSKELPPSVSVSVTGGCLSPDETLELTVTLRGTREIVLDPSLHFMEIQVRGGVAITVPASGEVIMPEVVVSEEEIAFGGVTMGGFRSRRLTLVNNSPITTEVSINLLDFPEFYVAPPNLFSGERDDLLSIGDESIFQAASTAGSRTPRLNRESTNERSNNSLTRGQSLSGKSFGSRSPRSIASKPAAMETSTDANEDDDSDAEAKPAEKADPDAQGVDPRFTSLPRNFKVRLNANTTLPFDFLFRPTVASSHSFSLPLTLVGAGPLPALQRMVTARGLPPRVKLEPGPVVDFEYRVVFEDTTRRVPYTYILRIRNVDKDAPVMWRADVSFLKPAYGPQVFTFEPDRGVIAVGESMNVKIQFAPTEADKPCLNTVPLYVLQDEEQSRALAEMLDTDFTSSRSKLRVSTSRAVLTADEGLQPYVDIELKGRPIAPQLSFDVKEVVLPPVPLGVESRATFHIIANGYDHLELKHAFSTVSKLDGAVENLAGALPPLPLSVAYPQGNILSLSRTRLPVVLSFKASNPIASTMFIVFKDKKGRTFSIPISVCADCSLCTTFTYIETHAAQLMVEAPGEDTAPVTLVLRDDESSKGAAEGGKGSGTATGRGKSATTPAARPLPVFQALSAATNIAPFLQQVLPADSVFPVQSLPFSVVSPAAASALTRWLNLSVFKSPITAFPDALIEGNSKVVFDVLESLVGEPIPGRLKVKLPTSKKARAMLLFTQSKDLLTFLRSRGALLPWIRPENLLSKDDFVQVRKNMHKGFFGPPFGANVLQYPVPAAKKQIVTLLTAMYPAVSLESWFHVFMQIIKIFLLPRITVRVLATMNGMVLPSVVEDYLRYLFLRESAVDAAIAQLDDKREISMEAVAAAKNPSKRKALDAAASAVMDAVTDSDSVPGLLSPGTLGATPRATESLNKSFDFTAPELPDGLAVKEEGRAAAALRATVIASSGPQGKRRRPSADISATLPHDPTDVGFHVLDAVAHAAAGNLPTELNQLMSERSRIQRAITTLLTGDESLKSSNAFGHHELLLLRWATYHRNRGCATAAAVARAAAKEPEIKPVVAFNYKKLIAFDSDFLDGTAWIFILISHAPELCYTGATLDFVGGKCIAEPKNNRDVRTNATAILAACAAMHLDPPFTVSDICPDVSSDLLSGDAPVIPPQEELENQRLLSAAELVAKEPQGRSVQYTEPKVPPHTLCGTDIVHKPLRSSVPQICDNILATENLQGIAVKAPKTPHMSTSVYSAKQGLLWVFWAFQNMPQLVPRTIVDFEGFAGTRITRSLTLHNPSAKPLIYDVIIEGASDFTPSTPSVRIEPGSIVKYAVSCAPRFAHPVHAKLIFRTRRDGTTPVQALVFALRSVVTGRVPAGNKEVTCRTYDSQLFDLEVRNTLGKDATFDVTTLALSSECEVGENVPLWYRNALQNSSPSRYVTPAEAVIAALQEPISLNSLPMIAYPPPYVVQEPPPETAAVAGKPNIRASDSVRPDSALAPFWSKHAKVTLRAGQAKRIPVQFAPLRLGRHRAAIVLTDANQEIGELVYELVGQATHPGAIAHIVDRVPFMIDPTTQKPALVTRLLAIPCVNAQLEGAEEALIDRFDRAQRQELSRGRELSMQKAIKQRYKVIKFIQSHGVSSTRAGRVRGGNTLGGVIDPTLREFLKFGEDGKPQGVPPKSLGVLLKDVGTFFKVECDSPFFSVPEQVFIPGPLVPLPFGHLATAVPELESNPTVPSVSSPGTARATKRSSKTAADKTGTASIAKEATQPPVNFAKAFSKQNIELLSNWINGLPYPSDVPSILEALRRTVPHDFLQALLRPALFAPNVIGSQRTFQAIAAQIAANTLGVPTKKATLEMAAELAEGIPDLSTPVSIGELIAFSDDEVLPLLSKLPIQLTTNLPGVYRARLTLTHEEDVRVFDVEVAVEASEATPQLLLSTTAMQACTQVIPVVNTTDHDWILLPQLQLQDRSAPAVATASGTLSPLGWKHAKSTMENIHFTAPPRIVIPSGDTYHLPVTFFPPYPLVEDVVMNLEHDYSAENKMPKRNSLASVDAKAATKPNKADTEEAAGALAAPALQYHLHGTAAPAVATDELKVDCITGRSKEITVTLYNFDKRSSTTFIVETDLPGFEGAAQAVVPAALVSQPADIMKASALMTSSDAPAPTQRPLSSNSRGFSPLGTPFGTPSGTPLGSRRGSMSGTKAGADSSNNNNISSSFHAGSVSYTFKVTPSSSGTMHGHITFRSKAGDEQMQWYAVQLTSIPPPPLATIELVSQVRKALAAVVEVANAADRDVTYQVELLGHGLLGELQLFVPRNSTARYEFLYAPLVECDTFEEGSLRFCARGVGEVSYAFKLLALPADPVTLPLQETPVGAVSCIPITIENPLLEPATVMVAASHPYKTSIRHRGAEDALADLIIAPQSSVELDVCYSPESIGELDECIVVLVSDEIGKWEYIVTGRGLAPAEAPTKRVFAEIGTTASSYVLFTNPFTVPITVFPTLDVANEATPAPTAQPSAGRLRNTVQRAIMIDAGLHESVENPVMLLDDKPLTVAPKATVRVPFSFAPKLLQISLVKFKLEGRVGTSSESVCWIFPVSCCADAPLYDGVSVINLPLGASRFIPLTFPVEHIVFPTTVSSVRGNLMLQAADEAANERLMRAVAMIPTKTTITRDDRTVAVDLQVNPTKCMTLSAEVILTIDQVPGRWRFPVTFTFTPPKEVMKLELTAPVGGVASAIVPCQSPVNQVTPFRAVLSADSDPAITVSPTDSVLQPLVTSSGVVVYFQPVEYGRHSRAHLVLESECFEWHYDVFAGPPAYNPPTKSAGSKRR